MNFRAGRRPGGGNGNQFCGESCNRTLKSGLAFGVVVRRHSGLCILSSSQCDGRMQQMRRMKGKCLGILSRQQK